MFSFIVKIIIAIILGLGGVIYLLIVPNPNYLLVISTSLVAAAAAGWAISNVLQYKSNDNK